MLPFTKCDHFEIFICIIKRRISGHFFPHNYKGEKRKRTLIENYESMTKIMGHIRQIKIGNVEADEA